ncbi:MAG: hypothetical protein DI537_38865 [Stutzerimonas stutzeri]|nr:MAG: hypothetical protein DI537_38865 [Stutzerimonas stutzeri]
MSFLKSLFGGRKTEAAKPAGPVKSIEHAGFTIHATPYQEGGQYQLCGVVEKDVGGEVKSHRFVRADRFVGIDEAAEFTLSKGRQLVDLEGERLFK